MQLNNDYPASANTIKEIQGAYNNLQASLLQTSGGDHHNLSNTLCIIQEDSPGAAEVPEKNNRSSLGDQKTT